MGNTVNPSARAAWQERKRTINAQRPKQEFEPSWGTWSNR